MVVKVGNQNFDLLFDTGSSDLWIYSSLETSAERYGHPYYKPSSSAKLMKGYRWQIQYAGGNGGAGLVYADTASVGSLTANPMPIEAAQSNYGMSSQDPFSGIIGMGFHGGNTIIPVQQQTWFDRISTQLKQPLFTSKLPKGSNGVFDFGYIDKSKYTGNITYTPVNTANGYWGFTAGSYKVGNKAYSTKIGYSVLDTGTTLFYAPQQLVENYYKGYKVSFDSSNNLYYECSQSLPTLTINIGTGSITIPGSSMNIGQQLGNMCLSGMQVSDVGLSIFGDVFLQNVFVVWNHATGTTSPQLGFATPK